MTKIQDLSQLKDLLCNLVVEVLILKYPEENLFEMEDDDMECLKEEYQDEYDSLYEQFETYCYELLD